jgi:hypothetical protein
MTGARIFVGIVFTLLALAFVASVAVVFYEFGPTLGITLATAHSHLFVFFPTFGLLALIAFFLPSVVFTHLYWTHVKFGRARFLFGFLVVVLVSLWVTDDLGQQHPRGVWEVKPSVLYADRGDPAGCKGPAITCRRKPVLESFTTLRADAQTTVGLSRFARICKPDERIERPEDWTRERLCYPSLAKATTEGCCLAQAAYKRAVGDLWQPTANRSLAGTYDFLFLFTKTFFVLVVIAIGFLLTLWRKKLDVLYPDLVPEIERGVLIGAFLMLLWALMDYGYQQTSNVLFGRDNDGLQFRLSLVIAPWALLLLFYFLQRFGETAERFGQLSGIAASTIALLRYEQINDWSVRLMGIGADTATLALLAFIWLLVLVALFWPLEKIKVPPRRTFG